MRTQIFACINVKQQIWRINKSFLFNFCIKTLTPSVKKTQLKLQLCIAIKQTVWKIRAENGLSQCSKCGTEAAQFWEVNKLIFTGYFFQLSS